MFLLSVLSFKSLNVYFMYNIFKFSIHKYNVIVGLDLARCNQNFAQMWIGKEWLINALILLRKQWYSKMSEEEGQ